MPRYWYDSFPGVKVETDHPWLDPYGTPYLGPESIQISLSADLMEPFDRHNSVHTPHTTVSQNRGGRA